MLEALLEWLEWPGETVTGGLARYLPAAADFLRAGPGGANEATLSITISALSWITLLLLVAYLIEVLRNVDRKMTSYVSGRYAESGRLFRVLGRRIRSAIGQWRERRREPDIAVSEIELERLEATVLRCYGAAGELRVLAVDEVAERLRVSLRQVELVIRRLMEHHLLERAFATDEGRDTHRITQAGQIYLIER